MKPDTHTAMHNLIQEVRSKIPFDMPETQVCSGKCNGCSLKLLEFLDMELVEWEMRLKNGEKPNFGDLHYVSKVSQKIYKVLVRNDLVPPVDK